MWNCSRWCRKEARNGGGSWISSIRWPSNLSLSVTSRIKTRPVAPGAVIAVRPIGVLRMTDEAGGDEKIVAVPSPRLTQRYVDVENYTDLQEMTWRRIEHFFVHYKDLEPGKWAKVAGWGDAAAARELINEAIERAKAAKK